MKQKEHRIFDPECLLNHASFDAPFIEWLIYTDGNGLGYGLGFGFQT